MRRARPVLAGLWVLAAVPAARAQDTVVVGIGGELSAPVGETVRVPVFADLTKAGTHQLGSYTVRVSWNPAVLSYQGWRDGTFATPLVQTDSSRGVLWASAISAMGRGGTVNLLDLLLVPLVGSGDSVRLAVTELSAAGSLTDLLAASTVLVRGAPFCPALGRWGDLDGDRRANSRDALVILSNLVGLPVDSTFNLLLGDVDGDGRVNSRDALIVLSYAVGVEIPGQRVLLVAAGPCTGSVPQFAALPDTADLVVGQSTPIRVFGRDSAGRATALNNLSWSVADPRIAAVDAEGKLIAREVGSTVVTAAIGPGAKVRIPVVVRQRRGTWFVDAPRAKRAVVQLGTQKWPFATPEYAFPLVSEGDTIRVAPGVVDYEQAAACQECSAPSNVLAAGVVVIGDTLPDGTRPLLRGLASYGSIGFQWRAGIRAELKHLVLRDFQTPVQVNGLRSLLLENVRIEQRARLYGYGVDVAGYVDTIRIHRSELVADTSGYQSYAGLNVGGGARLVEVLDSKFWYWGDGAVTGKRVDSLDVRRSHLSYTGFAGIAVDNGFPGTAPLHAFISGNRFVDNYYEAVRISAAGRVALDHNYIFERDDDAIQIYGPSTSGPAVPGTKVSLLGDSIQFRADDWNWLDVQGVDSLLVDSLWLENPADTALYQFGYVTANYARFTNSELLNLYNQGFEFRGRQLVVANTQFTGCSVCDWTGAVAIQAAAGADSGPTVNLASSSFSRLSYVLAMPESGTKAGPVVVTNNTADSVQVGFDIRADSVLVADNRFTKVGQWAVRTEPSLSNRPFQAAVIQRNQIACHPTAYTSWGIIAQYTALIARDNTIRNCDTGILHRNSTSYSAVSAQILRDTVVSDSGVTGFDAIILSEGSWTKAVISGNRIRGWFNTGINLLPLGSADSVAVDTNAVSGNGTGILVNSGAAAVVTGLRNHLSNNQNYGVQVQSGGVRRFNLSSITGNGIYGIYNTSGSMVDATNNWWGGPAGPRCGGGGAIGCDTSSTSPADRIYGLVDGSSHLTAQPTDVPPLAPPALRPVAEAASPAAARSGAIQPSTSGAIAPPSTAALPASRAARPDRTDRRAARQAAKEAERAARLQAPPESRARPARAGSRGGRPH